MFPWAIAACVIIALANAYRILRVRSTSSHRAVLNTSSCVY
jgi:hypothetical protein